MKPLVRAFVKPFFKLLLGLSCVLCLGLGPNSGDARAVRKIDPSAAQISSLKTEKDALVRLTLQPDTVFNFDAPWKLKVSFPENKGKAPLVFGSPSVKDAKTEYRFSVDSKDGVASYHLVYFVCNTRKTWCKRLVHEGEVN